MSLKTAREFEKIFENISIQELIAANTDCLIWTTDNDENHDSNISPIPAAIII